MRYIIDIADNKSAFAEEFFKTISFVKTVTPIAPNEITKPSLLKSIEDYETRRVKPTPLNLEDLKALIRA